MALVPEGSDDDTVYATVNEQSAPEVSSIFICIANLFISVHCKSIYKYMYIYIYVCVCICIMYIIYKDGCSWLWVRLDICMRRIIYRYHIIC